MDLYLLKPALVLKLLDFDFGGKLPEVTLMLGIFQLSHLVMPNSTFGGIKTRIETIQAQVLSRDQFTIDQQIMQKAIRNESLTQTFQDDTIILEM